MVLFNYCRGSQMVDLGCLCTSHHKLLCRRLPPCPTKDEEGPAFACLPPMVHSTSSAGASRRPPQPTAKSAPVPPSSSRRIQSGIRAPPSLQSELGSSSCVLPTRGRIKSAAVPAASPPSGSIKCAWKPGPCPVEDAAAHRCRMSAARLMGP